MENTEILILITIGRNPHGSVGSHKSVSFFQYCSIIKICAKECRVCSDELLQGNYYMLLLAWQSKKLSKFGALSNSLQFNSHDRNDAFSIF